MRVHPDILFALKATELPWELQMGKKHMKLRVNGTFVGILPKSTDKVSSTERAVKNTIAQIRRCAAGLAVSSRTPGAKP